MVDQPNDLVHQLQDPHTCLSILAVGEGDFTFSLALIRAYGSSQVDLTASTLLLSAEEVIATYSNAARVLKELEHHKVTILYGVDATQLHKHDFLMKKFDVVLFQHPHLGGLSTIRQHEAWHAERHYQLLAHYFWSASQISRCIHVCLCGTQPETWRLRQAAANLQLLCQVDTTTPPPVWLNCSSLREATNHAPAPRKYRNGRLGSRHYLGRFGYQHRPTHPSESRQVHVEQSQHFVYQTTPASVVGLKQTTTETICAICDVVFDSPQELQGHLQAPAVPSLPVAEARAHKVPTCENHDNTLNDYIQEPKQSIGDVEWIVEVDDTSRELRLRHFLQQHSKLSKNQAEKRLQQSCVTVNQVVVRNPTHRLEAKDVVEMRQLVSDPLPVDIVYHKNSIVVAFKPVGMRTVGSFSPETLESRVSNQLGVAYHSLSKMTTGCAGLVVLQPARTFSGQMVVEHIFTALVHGCVEWTEKSFHAVIEGARLWKKRPSQEMSADESSYDGDRDSNQEAAADTMVHVLCTEQCRDPPLSTLVLTCLPSVRADSISYTLRTKLGHAVVNDRFAKSEYLSLPRSIRNLIKNRFCMGCFAVRLSGEAEITKPVPERLSAHRWRQHVLKGEKTDKERKNPV